MWKLPALQLTKAADKTKQAIVPNARLMEATAGIVQNRGLTSTRTGCFDGFPQKCC